MERTKCLIIGSGPAGYTAAIYASRANLQPIEYSGMQPGGQLTQTTEVENFPGYPQGVDGNQMMMDLLEQAQRFGTDVRMGEIVKVDYCRRRYRDCCRHGYHCHGSISQVPRPGRRAQVQRSGRIGLCHLRRFLLPQEDGGRGGRWRHSL